MRFYRPISTIKALSFDLDDTLYNNDPIIQRANQALSNFLRINYPKAFELFLTDWRRIQQEAILKEPELASDPSELRKQGLDELLKVERLPPNKHTLAVTDCYNSFYNARSDFEVSDQVSTTLAQLAKYVPLVAITNGNVNIHRIGLGSVFTHTFHASKTSPMKPHKHMFIEACKMLSLAPKDILHVGDNTEKDVLGAHLAGLHTAWLAVNRPMHLNKENIHVLPSVQLSSLNDLLFFFE